MPKTPTKPYRDMFGNPISKQDVKLAVQLIVKTGKTSPHALQSQMPIGYGKAIKLITILADAGVLQPTNQRRHIVVIKNVDEATNLALRQLKKGRE